MLTQPHEYDTIPNPIEADVERLMNTKISLQQAIEIMQMAASEPAGLLIYASDRNAMIQMLYRARREDPDFQDLHIKTRPEGVVVWHERTKGTLW